MKRSVSLFMGCLLLCLPVVCWGQPFQAVKWPKSSQLSKIAAYKTTITDSKDKVVAEVSIPAENAQIAWIDNGMIVFKQPAASTGVPVKIICDYGALGLADGEYTARVTSCNAAGKCSKILDSPIVYMEIERKRRTVTVPLEGGSSESIIEYKERWKVKVLQPKQEGI